MRTVAEPVPTDHSSTHVLERLVSEHGKPLHRYVEKLLNDRHLAEDIVQETLIRAWHHTERLHDGQGSVRGWLMTVARHLAVDRARRASFRLEVIGVEDRDVARSDDADAVVASVQATALLRQLPRTHRDVLVHTFLYERTVQETAEILGIPPGTVKSRRYHALSRLRSRTAPDPARRGR